MRRVDEMATGNSDIRVLPVVWAAIWRRSNRNVSSVMADGPCPHIGEITAVKHPETFECAECAKIGSQWVHLRTCQECGITLCCDSSPNRHASKHARASGHPVIASGQPGERWLYCYPDEAFAEY